MRLAVLLTISVPLGCASARRDIRIPDNLLEPEEAEVPRPAERPYVIKVSDGRRTWQIEIPNAEGAPAFEAAIPLDKALGATEPSDLLPATEADREIIDAKRQNQERVTQPPKDAEARPPSYLRTLARVRSFFKKRQYELALVELVRLERVYADDIRILEMKGTLLLRLGRTREARAAWERVLILDPDNQVVLRALETLQERGD